MGHTNLGRTRLGTRLLIAIVAVVVLVLLLSAFAQAVPAQAPLVRETIPGFPTRQIITPATEKNTMDGAIIRLRGTFSSDWPWGELPWYDLWTAVQWQDPDGEWHTVEGWQGTFDTIECKDGVYTAFKTWWLSSDQHGDGPFRWLVYANYQGADIAVSEPFYLPGYKGSSYWVDVALTP